MAGQSSAMFGRSWTEVSFLGSQVFGQPLMESSEGSGMGHFGHCHQANKLTKIAILVSSGFYL